MSISRRGARGFTLIELVLTLVLVGILAAVGFSRWFDRRTFDTRGYSDEVAAMLRYAQKSAIAKRRNVCVAVTAGNVTLSFATAAGDGCNADPANIQFLAGPTGEVPFGRNAPPGISLSPAGNFSFDPLGRPSGRQDISVTGDFTRTVTIEAETGYVHAQ